MKIDLIFLIILGIVVAYIFVLYRIDKVETMADVSITDQMKNAISQIYNADVEAIRNLSNVATKLQAGGLTVPGNLKVGANLATNGLDPANMPDGWGGGLRIFDGYSSGTIGFGPDGKKLNAYMNSNGDMRSINMNTDNATINGNANVTGDIVFNGANKWIIHTPDDNRRIMYMAPANDKGEWMWDKQTVFNNDGSVQLSGALTVNGRNILNELNRLNARFPNNNTLDLEGGQIIRAGDNYFHFTGPGGKGAKQIATAGCYCSWGGW